MDIVTILSFTPAAKTATIQQPDGTILTVPVSVDFANFVGLSGFYDSGVLLISPQPPVAVGAADPATVIEGALFYNTTTPALKIGHSGAWVAV
jgi:hypothetical protein